MVTNSHQTCLTPVGNRTLGGMSWRVDGRRTKHLRRRTARPQIALPPSVPAVISQKSTSMILRFTARSDSEAVVTDLGKSEEAQQQEVVIVLFASLIRRSNHELSQLFRS
jgi:hypothetical protein